MDVINESKCNFCYKIFPSKMKLLKHMKFHIKDKPFSCDYCFKTFSFKSWLIIHKRIHTGEKPFHCDVCDTSFFTKAHLKRHQKIHTGEQNHVCNVCGRVFARKGYLKMHSMTHKVRNDHTEQQIESNYCGVKVVNKDDIIPSNTSSSLQRICEKGIKVNLKKVCIKINKLKIKTHNLTQKMTIVDAKETRQAEVSVDIEDTYIKDRVIETEQIEADVNVANTKESFDGGEDNNIEEDQVPDDACQQCSRENRNVSQSICPHFFKLN